MSRSQFHSFERAPKSLAAFHAGDRSGEALAAMARHERDVAAGEWTRNSSPTGEKAGVLRGLTANRDGHRGISLTALRSLKTQALRLFVRRSGATQPTRP